MSVNDGKELFDLDIALSMPEIAVTKQQLDAVRELMGQKSFEDTLRAILEYEKDPVNGSRLASGMFAYGVAYAAGRIASNKR